MQLLGETAVAVRLTVETLRSAIASVRRTLRECQGLQPALDEWEVVIHRKLELLLSLAEPSRGKPDEAALYWDSSKFLRLVRSEPSFDVATATALLGLMRGVAQELNALSVVLSAPTADASEALPLVGHVIADFVDLENAVYLRYPHMEETED